MTFPAADVHSDHSALMDRTYRYQRFIYDLTRRYFLLGRDRSIRELDVPANANVLEVACGTGGIITGISNCNAVSSCTFHWCKYACRTPCHPEGCG